MIGLILALSSKKLSEALHMSREVLGEILDKISDKKNFNLTPTEKTHAIEIMDNMKQDFLQKLSEKKPAEVVGVNIFEKGRQFFSSLAKSNPEHREKFYAQKTEFVKKYIPDNKQNTEQQNQR
ncbi:hypothetical protein NOVO_04005 [Rickettsiales bacterium Ac37b]|nr:hypothetical protein NOVO_04005 [Rickettsiales bacterium Ac37b]